VDAGTPCAGVIVGQGLSVRWGVCSATMRLCPLAIAALAAMSMRATAAPLVVVVREGSDDALAVARLRGQLADLDVTLTVARGAIEAALDHQLASAARLAEGGGARAVVWFI